MKVFLASVLFVSAWSVMALAQVPAAVPASGIMAWITAHGGFQGAVLLLVGSAFTILSAFRKVLSDFDGVPPGGEIPAGLTGLTLLNKICVILGKIIDYATGNLQH